MIRRLFRDWLDGLRAGWDVLWWGQAYPPVSDMQVTYFGGLSVRRVEGRRTTEWFVDGQSVSERYAKACMLEAEDRLRRP